MKLIKAQKKDKGKNQAQELYPKVKTFSKAYDFAPKKEEPPVVPSGDMPFFALDERPYPMAVPPVNYPEIPNKSTDFNDPERIDLQDTLLTDESFTGRPLKPSAAVSFDPAINTPAGQFKPEEKHAVEECDSEETEDNPAAEEEDFWKTEKPDQLETPEESDEEASLEPFFGHEPEEDAVGSFCMPEPEDNPEFPYKADPEAEYETDSFYEPDEETDPDPDTDNEPIVFPASDPEGNPGLPDKSEEETDEPFSWFDSDEDTLPKDSTAIAFKKKEYTAQVGKKKNLKKKLKSKPSGSLKWKSSDTKIAKVSRKGILKPKKKGKVTVRVKAKGGERAKVKIRIISAKAKEKKKKQKVLLWESVGAEKKAASDKKWVRFA